MPDITISTGNNQPEQKQVQTSDVEKAVTTAMEIERINKETEALEQAVKRQDEVRAKLMQGGRALAGQPNQKTPEEEIKEEAAKILKPFL